MPPNPLPPFDYSRAPYGSDETVEPNEPWDPNEPDWDPNDPNFPGFLMMGMGEDQISLEMQVYDPLLEAQQLMDAINFFSTVEYETQEEADNIAAFIEILWQDLEAICQKEGFEL